VIDYTEILDTPSSAERAVRKPGDFKRKGVDGPPYVKSATGTRKRPGKKADLLAAARAEGHTQVDDTWTVAQLHELLGREPSWELYGRPSGYGDEIDNPYSLIKWKERQIALGFAMRPELLHQLLRELDGITDGDEQAERAALDKIAAGAHEAAGSDMAAARGTWIHLLTEAVEQGLPLPPPDPAFGVSLEQGEAIAASWIDDLLEANGLRVRASEFKVVNNTLRVAGSPDRLVELTQPLTFGDVTIPAGTVLILDIKTSKLHGDADGIPSYWNSYPLQVYAYATAQPYLIEGHWDADTGEWVCTDERRITWDEVAA
jgi:hypothetical protein